MSNDMADVKEKVDEIGQLAENMAADRALGAERLAQEIGKVARLRAELDDVAHTLAAAEGGMAHKPTSEHGRQIEQLAVERGTFTRRTLGIRAKLSFALRGAFQVLEDIAEHALQGKLRGVEGGAVLWREALENIHTSAAGAAAKASAALEGEAE